jgi:hypothetical protein
MLVVKHEGQPARGDVASESTDVEPFSRRDGDRLIGDWPDVSLELETSCSKVSRISSLSCFCL